jgi:hypothetical protein
MIETETITVSSTGQQTRIPLNPAKNNMIICNAGASDIYTVQGAAIVGSSLINIEELTSWKGSMQEMLWANFAEISINVASLVSAGFTFKIHSSPKH